MVTTLLMSIIERSNYSNEKIEEGNRVYIQPITTCRTRSIMITCLFLISKMGSPILITWK